MSKHIAIMKMSVKNHRRTFFIVLIQNIFLTFEVKYDLFVTVLLPFLL